MIQYIVIAKFASQYGLSFLYCQTIGYYLQHSRDFLCQLCHRDWPALKLAHCILFKVFLHSSHLKHFAFSLMVSYSTLMFTAEWKRCQEPTWDSMYFHILTVVTLYSTNIAFITCDFSEWALSFHSWNRTDCAHSNCFLGSSPVLASSLMPKLWFWSLSP